MPNTMKKHNDHSEETNNFAFKFVSRLSSATTLVTKQDTDNNNQNDASSSDELHQHKLGFDSMSLGEQSNVVNISNYFKESNSSNEEDNEESGGSGNVPNAYVPKLKAGGDIFLR